MAKNYIDNLSEEVRKGMAEKVASGEFPHRAPPGYLNDVVNHVIIPDPERAPYVARMYDWYATGRYSLDDIHRRCIQDGFTAGPRFTRPPARSEIETILKNPFYTGRFRWRGQLHPGKHNAIVSQELWDRVQSVFSSRGRSFAFGGLITCGVCGCAVTAVIKKGRYVYYKCTNFHGGCPEGLDSDGARRRKPRARWWWLSMPDAPGRHDHAPGLGDLVRVPRPQHDEPGHRPRPAAARRGWWVGSYSRSRTVSSG